ncbi:hypothetical protein RND71_043545 [Anisodus tanguticus]|uniref:ARMET N-terminal domain-containing protein n=1 Tax=Anisodus tanguticus TaxID=243964 RepID=A0AAE1UTX1_9SOLA|nr:hypothetical protein RND71_043545 [Anisodus tanguticus]
MSKPLSYSKPVEKVCEDLNKADEQICRLRYEVEIDIRNVNLKSLRELKDLDGFYVLKEDIDDEIENDGGLRLMKKRFSFGVSSRRSSVVSTSVISIPPTRFQVSPPNLLSRRSLIPTSSPDSVSSQEHSMKEETLVEEVYEYKNYLKIMLINSLSRLIRIVFALKRELYHRLDFSVFPDYSGTLGLAWLATPDNQAGICGYPPSDERKSQDSIVSNVGLVTSLFRSKERLRAECSQTLAHEIGHLFGSRHDDGEDLKDLKPAWKCPRSPGAKIEHAEFKNWQIIDNMSYRNFQISLTEIKDATFSFMVFFQGMEYKVYVRTRPYFKEFLEKVSEWFEMKENNFLISKMKMKIQIKKFFNLNLSGSKLQAIQGQLGQSAYVGQGSIGYGQGPYGQGPMGQGPMGQGPMGQGPMGQGPLGQGPLGQGPLGQGGYNGGLGSGFGKGINVGGFDKNIGYQKTVGYEKTPTLE